MKGWLKGWHWGWKELDLSVPYSSLLLAVMVIVLIVAFWPAKEKFNPELHDCTKWSGDISSCDLSNPILEKIKFQAGNFGMRVIVCHYGFKSEKDTDVTTATATFNDTCVSWQSKPIDNVLICKWGKV